MARESSASIPVTMNAQIERRDKLPTLFQRLNTSSPPENRPQDDGTYSEVEGKVKNRLLSMWNNMKYGMKLKTNFSKESPVWLLGKCYRRIESPSSGMAELGTDVAAYQSQSDMVGDDEGLESFKKDFTSRIWMTYRREFPLLNGSNYSSDCGWGCMLRSGQMMLAHALVLHFLGREWRWNPEQPLLTHEHCKDDVNHRKIIKWFGDKPSLNSPLSIHTLVSLGESLGKKAGDWYGPGFVAHLLRQAVKIAVEENYEFESLAVSVAQDCAVYIGDVLEDCRDKNGKWKSLILFIPVRLGAEKFNSVYSPCLTTLFSLKQCIGIIGGRPKHSLYFVGFQDDRLIHLDPHYCQEVVDVWVSNFPLASFHCKSPRKLPISKMDPSCCIGFYCSTREEFFKLIETVQPVSCIFDIHPLPFGFYVVLYPVADLSHRVVHYHKLIKLVIPPIKGNTLESDYPMFTFCDGHSRNARFVPKSLPPSELEYSTSSTENDDIETEEFEFV